MTSMTILLISIISIIAITGEAVDVDSNTKWHNDHINELSGALSRSKFQTMVVPEYRGLDIWTILRLQPTLDPVDPAQTLSETITTKPIASQHDGGRRNRRQAIESDKVKGEDYGSNSGSPLSANSEDVYPTSVANWILRQPKFVKMNQIRKSTLRNRRRRSASDKNITPSEDSCNDPTMKAIKCALDHSFPIPIPTQCLSILNL